MPMLTTSVNRDPVKPRICPWCTPVTKRRIFSSCCRTSGITSLPSASIGRSEQLRSAMCIAARRSVLLTGAPENSSPMRCSRPVARARSSSNPIVSPVTRCRVKSYSTSSASTLHRSKRDGPSVANSSRR